MTLAHQYAKALIEVKEPSLEKLKAALKHRGHEKLLPQIYKEYEKLMMQAERREMFAKVTPEREQKRILFELYKKLTA